MRPDQVGIPPLRCQAAPTPPKQPPVLQRPDRQSAVRSRSGQLRLPFPDPTAHQPDPQLTRADGVSSCAPRPTGATDPNGSPARATRLTESDVHALGRELAATFPVTSTTRARPAQVVGVLAANRPAMPPPCAPPSPWMSADRAISPPPRGFHCRALQTLERHQVSGVVNCPSVGDGGSARHGRGSHQTSHSGPSRGSPAERRGGCHPAALRGLA